MSPKPPGPAVRERAVKPLQPLTANEAELLAEVDGRQEELVTLVRELVRIDSRNTSEFRFSDRNPIVSFVDGYLRSRGIQTERYEAPFPHGPEGLSYPNLVATVRGQGNGRVLQFCGHLDVVDFTPEHWNPETPPLAAVIKDGRLYGRGAGDMKAGIACQMMALRLFREAGIRFQGRLQMWFTPDEETHGAYGSVYMTRHHLDVVKADATIIAESSAIPPLASPVLGVGEKGVAWLRLTFYGASGHGSMPKPRSNPINKAARFVSGIGALRFPRGSSTPGLLQLVRALLDRYRLADLPRLARAFKAARVGRDEEGPPISNLLRTTASLGGFHGGTMVNVIPDQCVLELDVRTLPGVSTRDVLTALTSYCARLGYRVRLPEGYSQADVRRLRARPVDVEVEIITRREGSFSDPRSEFGGLLRNAFEAVYKVRATHFLAPGFTDGGQLRGVGMKNVFVLGPVAGEVHAANEYCDLNSLLDATKTYLLAAYRYLRAEEILRA